MAQINDNYLKLKSGYIFPEIGRRVRAFQEAHPDARVIRLGIGDVTEPLPAAVVQAMHKAVEEMSRRESFRGYGPEQGYEFLRQVVARHDFQARGCDIAADEIFISDGAKCDTANILDIFGPNNTIAVVDPVYPVYVDTNVMAGHTGRADERGVFEGLVYLPATPENGFTPYLPRQRVDLIYLCYPNNPTGTAASRAALGKWVEYAKANNAVIFYDAAYEAYIRDPSIPHSIYEIPGGRDVAIEFRSFSKTAGFTGVRAAYTVVPRTLRGVAADGSRVELHRLWLRRSTTKFNGVSYIVQRGAEAVYSDAGKAQVRQLIDHYMGNAAIIRQKLASLGMQVWGGENAPYVWLKTPGSMTSWQFFDVLLGQAQVVCTPGVAFGASGEGFVRLSAFNGRQDVEEAVARIAQTLA